MIEGRRTAAKHSGAVDLPLDEIAAEWWKLVKELVAPELVAVDGDRDVR